MLPNLIKASPNKYRIEQLYLLRLYSKPKQFIFAKSLSRLNQVLLKASIPSHAKTSFGRQDYAYSNNPNDAQKYPKRLHTVLNVLSLHCECLRKFMQQYSDKPPHNALIRIFCPESLVNKSQTCYESEHYLSNCYCYNFTQNIHTNTVGRFHRQ